MSNDYDLWERSRVEGGTLFIKREEGTVRACMEEAFCLGEGLYEVWSARGQRLLSFVVGFDGIRPEV